MPIDNEDWVQRLKDEAKILTEARMLRDEQELTPEIQAEIFERFKAQLLRINRSEAWAAKSLGIGPSVLSQVLSGSYIADSEKHVRAIDKWLEIQYVKEHAPRPAGFVKTGVAESMYAATKWAAKSTCIVLVHGPAGIGKTITAQAIRAETPGSIYMTIKTAGQSALAVMDSLAKALRLTPQATRARTFAAIESCLRDTNRLIIIDEIHKLVGRRRDEALHCLRDLHDSTECPMLWLGQTNVATYIQNGHDDGYEPLDQIYSRIGFWLDLTEVANRSDGGPGLASMEDIQKIIAAGKIRITPDGARYLQMLACEFGQGAYRTISKLLQIAENFAKDKPIDAHMLRSIQRKRLGMKAAEALETRMELRTAQSA